MTDIFPTITDSDHFRLWRQERRNWQPILAEIAAVETLRFADVRPFSTGTNLVLALDENLILKIFPPLYRRQFEVERSTLALLQGRLNLSTPDLVAAGEMSGWGYLVMTRVRGITGSDVWPVLAEDDKERILGQIGETIAEVQSVPVGPLKEMSPAWPNLILTQIAACRRRHAGQGLGGKFLDDLDELVADAPSIIPLDTPPVILTGEYIPENFQLSDEGGRWHLSGLIDFGDVMTGWSHYDLLGPSAFMTSGQPRRVRRLLQGFGINPADIDDTWRRRLFIMMLLHRASDLRNVDVPDWQSRVSRLGDLVGLIWPTEN